ncbi:pisatin demethylase [Delitschia confertaspora ATCC 74209]|uniref:Cytochrome P450 monooxygenase ABA1 n=1 Tax=Delitschia confertaspora ATCC 74209 TaxID=1513339 RepID=A0A9P4MWP3_9PLEO|nr:pisatin demethylase [Delitschia confertaspora ATCC 74209]
MVSDSKVYLLRYIPQHPLYLALFALTAYFVINRIRQYWRLRQFKGPFSTGISWIWHSKAVLSRNAHIYYGDVNEKYGTIARIGPNHLLTSSPELWSHINAVRSPYTRSAWYYHSARFEPGKDNVFTECDNDKHDARRKKMASAYSGKENPTLEPSIDARVKELIHLIKSKYATPAASTGVSKSMDLALKFQFFTLDVISDIGLGSPFGDLKADADVNSYIKSSEEGLAIGNTSWALGLLWLRDLPIIGKAIGPSEKDEAGFGMMMAQARKLIESRKKKSTTERSDMIASFIRHGVSGDDLFHEVFEQILAGSDTTAGSLRIIMLFLMSHPRVYAKLQAEIDHAVRSGIAPASPDIVSDAQARHLPYMAAVIREAMRVHPPVVNLFSRVVPEGGDTVTVDGEEVFIPGGTLIGYSAFAMHRNNKRVYGEDAHIFRPERWMIPEEDKAGQERLKEMIKTNDLIFGYGRWVCLGKVVALIEIHKVVFELLRAFDFSLVNPHKPWNIVNSLGLFAITDMMVEVTVRE